MPGIPVSQDVSAPRRQASNVAGRSRRGGGGSEELFLKKKTTKNPGPFDGSNPGSLGAGRDVPGLAHTLPIEGLGCFKCIVF